MAFRDHPAVKAYCQHGFVPESEQGNQIVGDCPFCSRALKFYVNEDNKKWDCKVCERFGGFLTFLSEMTKLCEKRLTKEKATWLSKSRGVSIATLKYAHVGFNPLTNHYTLPTFQADGETVADLRIYTNGRLISTSGCKTGLWNSASLMNNDGQVWLCEGEWDGLAMWEIIAGLEPVVAVPGAAVFKPQWINMMRDRKVIALYDNDQPGRTGAIKAFNLLHPVTRELRFLHWSPETPDKFDIRDLYAKLKKPKEVIDAVRMNLHDAPPGAEEVEGMARQRIQAQLYTGEGVPIEEVYEGYRKWLHVPDTDVIDVLYGAMLANRLPGDPLWLFLVGPPGMTKTEFLSSMSEAKGIEAVSTLTPHALVSGASAQGGGDPSLIPLLDGKVLVIKDFTAILQMNQIAREEVFGILRDAYDGDITKVFGNYVRREYKDKFFGIIAGVTHAIEQTMEHESALGERFLRWEMRLPKTLDGQLDYLRKAKENVNNENIMRRELRDLASRTLDFRYVNNVVIPDSIEEQIMYLAVWTSLMRGTVLRDRFTREITARPFVEIGTRLSKQYLKWLYGVGMFRGIPMVGEDEYRILRRLARATVSGKIGFMVEAVYREMGSRDFTTGEVSEVVRLPHPITARLVENTRLLGIIEKTTLSSVKFSFSFSQEYHRIVALSRVYD